MAGVLRGQLRRPGEQADGLGQALGTDRQQAQGVQQVRMVRRPRQALLQDQAPALVAIGCPIEVRQIEISPREVRLQRKRLF
jgi:hypothetical protein